MPRKPKPGDRWFRNYSVAPGPFVDPDVAGAIAFGIERRARQRTATDRVLEESVDSALPVSSHQTSTDSSNTTITEAAGAEESEIPCE
jgi:hypothetical protein